MVADQELNASVDGKWAKQSKDAQGNPLMMVNVLAHDLKLCLAQWPATEKRYEPGVLREKLGRLFEDYPGLRLLTMDALYASGTCAAIVSHGGTTWCGSRGTSRRCCPPWSRGLPERNWESLGGDRRKKAGMIDGSDLGRCRIGDYIREELGYPGARQGAMVESRKWI